jgi:hypothetical protein
MTHHGGSALLDSAERPMLSGSGAPATRNSVRPVLVREGERLSIGIEYIDQPPGDGIIDDGPSLRSGRLPPDGGRPRRRPRDAAVERGMLL